MRIPSNTGVLLFFGVASCAVGFGACSGDEEPTQASGNSGNSGNSAGGARAGGAGPRGGTIGTSGTTKATGGATTGKATGGAGGAAPTNTGQVAMAGRGYAGTAGTSDIGTVVNPTDLSCLKMTSLWVRAQGPMAVGMLYRIETCKGETVQLVPKQGESVFTYYKLQEDGQNLSSECVPTVDLSQGQRVYVSLMLDLSTSTTGDAARVKSLFDSAKLFAENVPAASPKVFIGVRAFAGDTSPKDILLPTRDLAAVNAALDKTALDNGGLADPGSTNLYGAFKSGVEDLQTWQEKILANNQGGVVTSGYLVVFTDGRDTSKLVEQSTAIATVSGARAAGATAESRPNVQTYAVALAEGADYTLDAKKDLQAVVGVGTDSRLIEGSLSTLSARFQELAKRIGEQAAGTHLLKYCSAARSQKTAVTLGVNPSIGGTDPTSTRLGFTFDAATLDVTAYKGGCIAYFQNVCLESNCGGYNCGACDESIETCESTTTSIPSGGTAPPVTKTVYRCTNNCIDQNRCSGETLTNWAGYTQSCSFTGVVGKCINVCTDLQSDSKNCGVCGKTCNTTAGESCVQGVCSCSNGGTVCGGKCQLPSFFEASNTNCGTCGKTCNTTAGESCVQGVCGCTNGGTICAGTCQLPSFFEANNANCGTCGKTCNTTAGESCVQGVCACPSGGTICGGTCRLPSFFETSNANCGICGNACPTGIACSGRVCQCPTGEVACSGTCRAVSFFVDNNQHCGACGNACPCSGTTCLTVASIAAGGSHTCARFTDGTVQCWGANNYAQLGDGTTTQRLTPVEVTGLTAAAEIAAGQSHTCAWFTDGTVKCWGYNEYGQLGDGTKTTPRLSPVAVTGLTEAAEVAAGTFHTCALLTGGTVKCWGSNSTGELGDGTTTDRLTPVAVTGLTGVAQIAVGYHHTCARLTDGTVKCWGNGGLGDGTTTQRLTPVAVTGLTGAVEIATRSAHTCALLTGGTVKCWGGNVYGQLGDGTTTTPRLTPVAATGLTGVAEISAGQGHTCARLTDGTVKCWGHNELGQLGYGATTYVQMTPVAVTGLTGAAEISAGYYYHTCARLTDRTVKCWGTNSTGQLGDGTTTQRTTPTVVVW